MSCCPLCNDELNEADDSTEESANSAAATEKVCPRCGYAVARSRLLLDELSRRAAEQLQISSSLVTAATPLLELPVDSLGLVEFVTELERDYGVNLLEQAWSEDVTYGDVVRIVLRARYPEACP